MLNIKRGFLVGIIVALGALSVGCGSTQVSQQADQNTKQEVVQKGQTEQADKQEDMATGETEFTDRVVVSSVAGVQILDALGIPMVGVPTSSYELPESVQGVTQIGSAMSPDMEVITSLEPTVVISVDSLSEDLKSQFETLGIASEFINLSSYEGLKESIIFLGERFNVSEKAAELVGSLEAKEASIQEMVEEKESPTALIIFGAGQSFMVASEASYVGDLAKRVGITNVIENTTTGFSPVDMEYLAHQNPEYILFMAHANPEESLAAFKSEFETNAAWQNFEAVKNDRVVALETEYFGMSANLLVVDAMEKLVEIVYAE